ncbi:whey acidic -like [Pelobates cultripes]|uniref:Whey acidic -like n=1 Tax=Pelobates cultripes TaxID=61616 RepID=A0AAD1VQ05_PELCU|nr:whey acidic -like [Pelobates cultripes]
MAAPVTSGRVAPGQVRFSDAGAGAVPSAVTTPVGPLQPGDQVMGSPQLPSHSIVADLDLLNVCPPFDPSTCPLAKPEPDECKFDNPCPSGKKCCCSNCGWKCVTPVQVKPGRCPPIKAKCLMPLPEPECQTDSDCPGKQKCCNICGNNCLDPAEEPHGVCPVSEIEKGKSLVCPSVLCSRDSDCAADEKCCVSADGQKCVKPSSGGADLV